MHPYFLPEKRCPDWTLLMQEMGKPSFLAEWDCLHYSFGKKASVSVDSFIRSLSDVGREGYFMKPQYAEAGAFPGCAQNALAVFQESTSIWMVQKSQFPAALTMFADDIRRNEWKSFSFSTRPRSEREPVVYRQPIKPPDGAWNDMQAPIRRTDGIRLGRGRWKFRRPQEDGRRVQERHSREPFQAGKWAWLKYPPHTEQYQNPRSLWLTWSPDKQYEEIGRDLLWAAHLDPVDSSIIGARARTNSLQRGRVRAKPGRSYKWAYVSPEVVMQEVMDDNDLAQLRSPGQVGEKDSSRRDPWGS